MLVKGVVATEFSLQQSLKGKLERVMGIEPTLSAWEAEVLPLNYTRLSQNQLLSEIIYLFLQL